MPVRPKDLPEVARELALECGECVVGYPANRAHYDWMFEGDLIVCEGCGAELMLSCLAPDSVEQAM